MTTQESGFLRLKIAEKEKIARDIWRFELTHPEGAPLPPFEAGSNLTLVAPNGMRRSYSLCNDSQERNRYVIAVKRDIEISREAVERSGLLSPSFYRCSFTQ